MVECGKMSRAYDEPEKNITRRGERLAVVCRRLGRSAVVASEWIKEMILNVGFTFVYLLFSAFCYFFVILFLSFFVNVKVLMANEAFKVKFMQQTPDCEFWLKLSVV